MLQIKDLNYNIGDRELLKEVQWIINPGRRYALIGPNGAGKTTLLKIINGELESDGGEIIAPKDYRIGFLPQEVVTIEEGEILETVLEGHRELLALERQIQQIHQEMESQGAPSEALLNRLGKLEQQFDLLGGYRLEAEAKSVLTGLGFADSDFHRSISDFSGGWRMRVYLARLLLRNPDLLLLDEPTNHLDLESLEWLEKYLRTFEGSMVIISHDRYFIDRLAQEIVELFNGRMTAYAGNYSFYERKKAENLELLEKKIEEQKAERQRLQKFIDRFRYKASKAAQVQSRVKMLEKLEKLEMPESHQKIKFNIQVDTPSYKDVVQIEKLSFRYETDWVLRHIDLNIYRGEKIALVGINGAGKTTLTRLMHHELTPQEGTLKLGERVELGYYAQHQVDTLNLDATIMEEVAETAAPSHRTRLRDILGVFQFSNDDPQKPVGVLSGGEKARVSLAKILLSPVNFLIMDEPTNHLDMASQEALEHALRNYDGTLLLISHDRYFLDKLVSRVIELKDGRLRSFEGNYSDYLNKRETIAGGSDDVKAIEQAADQRPESGEAQSGHKTKEQKRQEAEARQAISKERNQLAKAIADWEAQIEMMETRQGEIETLLADPETYQDGQKAADIQKEYGSIKSELTSIYEQWEQAQLRLETLVSQLSEK